MSPATQAPRPPQVTTGRVVGLVRDQERGSLVEGALLRVDGAPARHATDPRGRFTLTGLSAGRRILETSSPGYQRRADTVEVLAGRTLEVEITLAPEPIELTPILVVVRSLVLEQSGFYRRRDQGISGTLLTREEIEERRPTRLTDLFVSIPGVRVLQGDGVRDPMVVVPRGNLWGQGTPTCSPRVWLDGVPTTIVDLDQIRPGVVEGMEVYTGAGTPIAYNDACGAIVIWTRLPGRGRGRGDDQA